MIDAELLLSQHGYGVLVLVLVLVLLFVFVIVLVPLLILVLVFVLILLLVLVPLPIPVPVPGLVLVRVRVLVLILILVLSLVLKLVLGPVLLLVLVFVFARPLVVGRQFRAPHNAQHDSTDTTTHTIITTYTAIQRAAVASESHFRLVQAPSSPSRPQSNLRVCPQSMAEKANGVRGDAREGEWCQGHLRSLGVVSLDSAAEDRECR